MPARRKIVDLEKLRASLTTLCPRCGYRIPPAEIQRPASGQVKCPKCGATSESNTPTRQTA
jgi:transposase